MTIAPTSTVVLEPAAQEFAAATANPPYLFDLGPEQGREVVDEVQSGPIAKLPPSTSRTSASRAARPAMSQCGSCAPRARPARCR